MYNYLGLKINLGPPANENKTKLEFGSKFLKFTTNETSIEKLGQLKFGKKYICQLLLTQLSKTKQSS
jgi:hypothetical protein